LTTLLFHLYDHDDIRDLLRARLLELAGSQAARGYLAHMVLRQVDSSLRHHPAAPATQRHLGLAGSSPQTSAKTRHSERRRPQSG